MPSQADETCSHRAAVEALAQAARDETNAVSADEKHRVHEHLETCNACREVFAQRTAGRFPRFSDYTVFERIGKGGFGVVYKAFHHGKRRIEAIKVLLVGGDKL